MSIRRKDCETDDLNGQPDSMSIAPSEDPEVALRKKIKYGNRIQAFWALLMEFCKESSIHGVRYFAEHKRHWIERVWWVIAFGISLVLCGFLIHNVWIKWDQSPVIVSFAEKTTPVYAIPFPAITICPETKTYMKLFNFTDMYHVVNGNTPPYNASEEDIANMEVVSHLCEAHLTEGCELGTNFTDGRIFDTIHELAPNFNDTMFFCKWRNTFTLCQDIGFQPVLTEEGVCYTFNALNSKDIYTDEMAPEMMSVVGNPNATHWDLENGYRNDDNSTETYPFRVFGAGARIGFFALLRLYEADLDFVCRGPVQGFKILLHTPGEVPQVSKHYFRVPLLQEVLVSVKPNMITTSEGLRHYEPNRRQCYFNSERDLRFFKVYTQRNCELECLSNHTLKECGCVKFSMPRDRNTPVCGAAKLQCYNKAEDELLKSDFLEGLTKPENAKKGCNCLPACTSITYDAEISQAKFDWRSLFNAYKNPIDEFPGMQPARLSIFFKEHQFITSKRSELYGPTDFLANCGGLLGLFMGVSVLSIVEIIYYWTLRLCCTLRIRQRAKRRNMIVPTEQQGNSPGFVIETNEKKDHQP